MPELLQSKFVAPRLRGAMVARSRLTSRLDEGLAGNLILVCAPAGYGKSTLVAEWLATADNRVRCTWLTLDADDNESGRFRTCLIAALAEAVRELGETIPGLLQEEGDGTATGKELEASTAAAIINALARQDEHVVLVLDDYHVITNYDVHGLLFELASHLPEMVTFIVVTRVDPPMPLARMHTQGRLASLRAVDLRFSAEEVTEFLESVMGLALTEAQIALLAARTEGWISGLQLAGLSLQQQEDVEAFLQEFAGDDHNIRSYLVEEALAGQPVQVQRFLLATSILERLTTPLCDAVFGEYAEGTEGDPGSAAMSSQQILEYLEQHNLFILPLDEHGEWYRYHTLFAELLRFHLWREKRTGLPALHRRAAQWLESNGFAAEASRQYLAAGSVAEGNKGAARKVSAYERILSWLQRFSLGSPWTSTSRTSPGLNGHTFARGDIGHGITASTTGSGGASRLGKETDGSVPAGASDRRPAVQPLPEPLSEREMEVLALLAENLSYQEIAQRLYISLPTVKTHVTHVYSKLGVHSRDDALDRASEVGILSN